MHRDPNRTFGYFMESCVSKHDERKQSGRPSKDVRVSEQAQLSAADVGRAGCRGPLPVREPSCTA